MTYFPTIINGSVELSLMIEAVKLQCFISVASFQSFKLRCKGIFLSHYQMEYLISKVKLYRNYYKVYFLIFTCVVDLIEPNEKEKFLFSSRDIS